MKLAYGTIFTANTRNNEIDFGLYVYGDNFINMISEEKTIIFTKPLFKTKKVKELITGVEFDYVYYGTSIALKHSNDFSYGYMCGYKSKNKSITTGIVDNIGMKPTKKQLEDYIKEHSDIEAYKEFLLGYKEKEYSLYNNDIKYIKKRSEVKNMNR